MAKHIICITKNGTNPAYEGARIGARRIAEAAGYRISSVYPETPDDPQEQSALLQAALDQGPDAVMIAPADPAALDPILAQARAAGLPVVSFVSRSAALAPDCFVTSDNRALAETIAGHLIDHIGGTGRLAIIEGNPASETSAPRTDGFLAAIAAAPGITLAAQATGFYQRDPAAQAMADILSGTDDLQGVLVANDFMALGVIDALHAAGRRMPVVSVNAMPQAIAALLSGDLLATAAFDAMKIACAATMATIRLLEGQPVPRDITLPVDIVTAANCAPWNKGYEERPLPDWAEVTGG
ncbi:sugar ABC transporter substrate-binding protein [Puniceibacterium sediminis]|uniref:Monosaccharide ABC transporter substrate-binding protein, CUT2 family n=1 Tax=Puniceibacterium sediminis TaxID=1608407 RepID=A0A238X6V2_9RHOB|nr:sugar ABC transporter substrate-binding protein [Puniceibacterium sediminis]SNR54308.1 monosaccharide ABC transporter substrate-binding protein, CUT2 family [Puniceibacterium sediminis]